jgi:GT2 family glycosyltransferase
VLNWNGREDTLRCVAAVDTQLGGVPGAMVTVVDNGSTDGTIAAITTKYPRARLVPLPENRGFTGGIAAGVATSKARNVIFLNNDAVPEPGWLAALNAAMESAPSDVISIGGRIISMDGARIDFIGGVLTFDGHALQNGFRMTIGSRPEPKSGDEILFACGGNMISRREKLVDLGGFDDDYFAYLEDVDFGWRTWLSGARVLFNAEGTVRHASSATSNRMGDFERGVLFERNALQTAIKNFENLHENAGAILLTYMHRLHHYATTRNANAHELTRELGAPSQLPPRESGIRGKVKRRLRGIPPLAAIEDPLTAMQFRAFDWILRNEEKLVDKREEVQARRRRSDAEIFAKFPLQIVPTYPGDESLMGGRLFDLLRPRLTTTERKLEDIIER